MSEDILLAIDASIAANLCGCGCGQQIPARGPSPDFVNEKHQQVWSARGYRASGGMVAADWYTRLREVDVAHDPGCDPAGCPHHTMHARLASVTITIDESHTMRRWSLLRAIDKIRGIRR